MTKDDHNIIDDLQHSRTIHGGEIPDWVLMAGPCFLGIAYVVLAGWISLWLGVFVYVMFLFDVFICSNFMGGD